MFRATALSMALISLSACIVVDDDDNNNPPPQNYPPTVVAGEAGCYYDDYNHDFIWYFTAEVHDPNGPGDVMMVWGDVYDAYGNPVDSFELYPEGQSPEIWFSDWLQYSTYLDCYYGGYVVDLVAYDYTESYHAISVYPYTEAR